MLSIGRASSTPEGEGSTIQQKKSEGSGVMGNTGCPGSKNLMPIGSKQIFINNLRISRILTFTGSCNQQDGTKTCSKYIGKLELHSSIRMKSLFLDKNGELKIVFKEHTLTAKLKKDQTLDCFVTIIESSQYHSSNFIGQVLDSMLHMLENGSNITLTNYSNKSNDFVFIQTTQREIPVKVSITHIQQNPQVSSHSLQISNMIYDYESKTLTIIFFDRTTIKISFQNEPRILGILERNVRDPSLQSVLQLADKEAKVQITFSNGVIFSGCVKDENYLDGSIKFDDKVFKGSVRLLGKKVAVGEGFLNYPDGRVFKGKVTSDLQPSGKGIIWFPDGRIFEGFVYKDGLPLHCAGKPCKLTRSDGVIIEGQSVLDGTPSVMLIGADNNVTFQNKFKLGEKIFFDLKGYMTQNGVPVGEKPVDASVILSNENDLLEVLYTGPISQDGKLLADGKFVHGVLSSDTSEEDKVPKMAIVRFFYRQTQEGESSADQNISVTGFIVPNPNLPTEASDVDRSLSQCNSANLDKFCIQDAKNGKWYSLQTGEEITRPEINS